MFDRLANPRDEGTAENVYIYSRYGMPTARDIVEVEGAYYTFTVPGLQAAIA